MRKLAIGVLAATVLIAACGGSSKSNSAASGGTSGTTAKSSGGSDTTAKGGGDDSNLSKLAGEFSKSKIKITYTSTGGGDDKLTLAQDGNGKSSFTVGDSTFYADGKSSVACQGTGTAAHCTDVGSLGGTAETNPGLAFTASFTALASVFATLGGGDKSSDNIAGRDASCVKYKASDFIGKISSIPIFEGSSDKASDYDPSDTATICLDKQTGFVLKIAGTKKGAPQDQLVATAVSDPTDADFTPPVTPETVPTSAP